MSEHGHEAHAEESHDAHAEHGQEATAAPTAEKKNSFLGNGIDKAFGKVLGYIGEQISRFMAFLFFLFTLGALFGAVMADKFPGATLYIIAVPAILGLITYYNRTVATILFAFLIAGFILI